MARLTTQLEGILHFSDMWAGASGLALNPSKCIHIPASDPDRAASLLRDTPGYADVKIQKYGKYLGVMVGPDAAAHQWGEVRGWAMYDCKDSLWLPASV